MLDYEAIQNKHDFHRDILLSALDLVRTFIIDRKLILTGGMAIDYALRHRHTQLYTEETMPDYDFFSPDFHKDAYELGTQLVDEGYPNISVIRARHVSTMRVRINSVAVADITYIPYKIYSVLPTIPYQDMSIISPSYQMIDQHLSLSKPLSNPPNENMLDRWNKDMERHTKLYNEFKPVSLFDQSSIKFANYHIRPRDIEGKCLGGVPALLYWIRLAKDKGYSTTYPMNISKNLDL
jgi:hypothetical protein